MTDQQNAQWQEQVSDKADEILAAALAKGDSFSEGLCNWAIDRAEELVPRN